MPSLYRRLVNEPLTDRQQMQASGLSARGFATVRGGRWTAAQVAAILGRVGDGTPLSARIGEHRLRRRRAPSR